MGGPVTISITTCKHCPHRRVDRALHNGAEDWICGYSRGRPIKLGIEWLSEEPTTIPEWCPLRAKKETPTP